MSILDEIAGLRRRGADILRATVDQVPRDLAAHTGLSLNEARTWIRTATDFCGPTRFTAVRRRVLAAAEANGHSMQTLVMINTFARKLDTDTDAWQLREKLVSMAASHDEIRAAAVAVLKKQHNGGASRDAAPRLRHGVDHENHRMSFHLTVGMETGRDLLHSLNARAGSATGAGLTPQQRGKALLEMLNGDEGLSGTTVTPLVVVGASAYARIRDGVGDDIVLALSDGTTMTGADFINAKMTEHGFVGLFHPVEGPANLYRTERFFNRKQRLLAQAESPICAWPDCERAATACQTHHLTEWAREGHTNAGDAAMLCGYHNSVNGLPGRGWMIRDHDGFLKWVPPGHGPPRLKDHPVSTLGAMHLL